MKKIFFVLMLLSSVLMACSAAEMNEAIEVATAAALGTPPPPKYQTLAVIYLPSGTPQPAGIPDMAATMVYQNMVAGWTQQAEEQKQAEEDSKKTATAISVAATVEYGNQRATANAKYQKELATAQAISAEKTATYEAESVAATATQASAWSHATATERSWLLTQSAVETQQTWAGTATQQVIVVQATQDYAIFETRATAQAIEIESAELKLKKDRMTNNFAAWFPYISLFVLLVIGALYLDRTSRIGRIEHDHTGQLPGIMTLTKGMWRFSLPKLMASPVLEFGDKVEAPPLTDPTTQADIVRRAQAVDAIRYLPPSNANQVQGIAEAGFGMRKITRGVEIIEERTPAIGAVIDDAENRLLGDNYVISEL